MNQPSRHRASHHRNNRNRWLLPWRQPAPWLALVLLLITAASAPPRLWFWMALLVIVLLVGWIQAFSTPPADGD